MVQYIYLKLREICCCKSKEIEKTSMYFSERQENSVHLLSLHHCKFLQGNRKEQHLCLLSHRAVLKLDFIHNHPIHASHPLSFCHISENTKQQFFEKGHCASSARHTHKQMLILNSKTYAHQQTVLADRATNPNIQELCCLFIEWRKRNYGKKDGKQMFERLQDEVYTCRPVQ